jgi:hypothetical protein
MKTIVNYIKDIKTGKQLSEALRIKPGKTMKSMASTISIDIPTYDFDEEAIDFTKIAKTIKVPNKQYVVYIDKYRQSLPHLNSLTEMLMEISCWIDDFEDFDPTKDILYADNSLANVARWYLVDYLGLPEPDAKKYKNSGDKYYDAVDDAVTQEIHDNISILFAFANNDKRKTLSGHDVANPIKSITKTMINDLNNVATVIPPKNY